MKNYILPMFLSFFISFLLVPFARKVALKLKIMDVPKDDRKVHNKPIPYLGGVPIFIAFILVSALFAVKDIKYLGLIIGASLIFVMGLIDDKFGLNAFVKLIVQIIAAIILVKFGYKIEFMTDIFGDDKLIVFSKFYYIPITIIWIVGITNTINLIDGLDGLAVGITAFASLTFAYVSYFLGNMNVTILALILAGSALGFLPHNFNPASIFMGDCGSYFLGFVLAALSIDGALKGATALTIIIPVLILGLPIFDTAFAIIRRMIARKPIFQADKGHFHHRLLNIGMEHRSAVLFIYFISIMMNFLSIAIIKEIYFQIFILSILILVMILIPLVKSKKMEK